MFKLQNNYFHTQARLILDSERQNRERQKYKRQDCFMFEAATRAGRREGREGAAASTAADQRENCHYHPPLTTNSTLY